MSIILHTVMPELYIKHECVDNRETEVYRKTVCTIHEGSKTNASQESLIQIYQTPVFFNMPINTIFQQKGS
jgi:hypothetical protein